MPLTCEIDAYGDFLQALGPDANSEVNSVIVEYYYATYDVSMSMYIEHLCKNTFSVKKAWPSKVESYLKVNT